VSSNERAKNAIMSMKILLSAGERLLSGTLSRWGYEVVVASDGAEALNLLRGEDAPKLAILDWEMDAMRGPEVCKSLRQNQIEPYVYLIFLTEKSQKDDLLEAFEFGADDYLVKPFDGYELRAKLIVAKRILELQDRLVSMRENLRAQATHDFLTGLWNRQASLEALAYEISRAHREKKPTGLIMADLDYFKQINDTYGHPAGDTVLKAVGAMLQGAMRSYDTVGRYGGEEFVIVAPGCNAVTIMNRAEELRARVSREEIQTSEGIIHVTMSIGALSISGTSKMDAESALKAVDDALYRAKHGGRNRCEFADEKPQPVHVG
jgi:diguanylate cyclase (GGDEF)-like protein